MSSITKETKLESYEEVLKTIENRHEQCINGLRELGEVTANELAMHFVNKGITPYFSRNFVHPRLNELVELDKVEIIGKKKDSISNRNCAIYKLKTISN